MLSRFCAWLIIGLIGSAVCFAGTAELQPAVSQEMAGKRGTAVVVEVESGRLLAQYNLKIAARRLARPGSAVKPFTLLALLSSGKLDPNAGFTCSRKFHISGHKLDCGHPANTRPLDATAALAYSCNEYFATMAVRLTAQELQEAFLRAGLAGSSGLASAEATGEVGLAATREQVQLQAIGEDHVRVTPLALLAAYRNLARQRNHGPSSTALNTVFSGLDAATEYGMARLAQPAGAMKVAGKTGTALAEEGQWTHGWFAGFAPAATPEIAVIVFLEHGTGPTDAAPIAARIFAAYARRRH